MAGIVLMLASVPAGCGSSSSAGDDRSAIQRVLEDARGALLRNDGHAVCNLLTVHGRRRSLGYQVDYAPVGTRVPTTRRGVPRTCEDLVDREWRAEHRANVDQSWIPDLRRTKFVLVKLGRSHARVELRGPGPSIPPQTLTLVKTSVGWRVDDFSAVPSGY